jgi:hypothetical protein
MREAGEPGTVKRAMLRRRTRDDYLHVTWGSGGIVLDGTLRHRLAKVTHAIDWDLTPRRLGPTIHTGLADGALAIEEAARDPRVLDAARKCGIEPVLLVIGLMARKAYMYSKSAARFSRRLLRRVPEDEQFALAEHLGLVSFLDM